MKRALARFAIAHDARRRIAARCCKCSHSGRKLLPRHEKTGHLQQKVRDFRAKVRCFFQHVGDFFQAPLVGAKPAHSGPQTVACGSLLTHKEKTPTALAFRVPHNHSDSHPRFNGALIGFYCKPLHEEKHFISFLHHEWNTNSKNTPLLRSSGAFVHKMPTQSKQKSIYFKINTTSILYILGCYGYTLYIRVKQSYTCAETR